MTLRNVKANRHFIGRDLLPHSKSYLKSYLKFNYPFDHTEGVWELHTFIINSLPSITINQAVSILTELTSANTLSETELFLYLDRVKGVKSTPQLPRQKETTHSFLKKIGAF